MDPVKQPKLEDNLVNWNKIGRYSQWMFNLFAPYVGKRVIDIGVGVGNMMQFYIEKAELAIGTDIFDTQLDMVEQRFKHIVSRGGGQLVTQTLDIEQDSIDDLKKYSLDTVICINVLEHIADDLKALSNMKNMIVSGGKIILLVPAHSRLYNYMDKNAGHHRRYDRGQLVSLAKKLDLEILKSRYFNIFGIIPYVLKGKFGKKESGTFSSTLGETDFRLYNIASVILEPFEKVIKVPFGLSELIVLKK